MKRYGIPLLTIMIGYGAYHLIRHYYSFGYQRVVMTIQAALLLFVFGISMSTRSKNRSTWVKKTVIIGLLGFLIVGQLGLIKGIEVVSVVFAKLRLNGTMLFEMLYIYLGFIFF